MSGYGQVLSGSIVSGDLTLHYQSTFTSGSSIIVAVYSVYSCTVSVQLNQKIFNAKLKILKNRKKNWLPRLPHRSSEAPPHPEFFQFFKIVNFALKIFVRSIRKLEGTSNQSTLPRKLHIYMYGSIWQVVPRNTSPASFHFLRIKDWQLEGAPKDRQLCGSTQCKAGFAAKKRKKRACIILVT